MLQRFVVTGRCCLALGAATHRWVPPAGGRVVQLSRARATGPGFSHVVRYARGSALGSVEAASLLDAPSHGHPGRCRATLGAALPGLSLWLSSSRDDRTVMGQPTQPGSSDRAGCHGL